jgi:hypothetical protein
MEQLPSDPPCALSPVRSLPRALSRWPHLARSVGLEPYCFEYAALFAFIWKGCLPRATPPRVETQVRPMGMQGCLMMLRVSRTRAHTSPHEPTRAHTSPHEPRGATAVSLAHPRPSSTVYLSLKRVLVHQQRGSCRGGPC